MLLRLTRKCTEASGKPEEAAPSCGYCHSSSPMEDNGLEGSNLAVRAGDECGEKEKNRSTSSFVCTRAQQGKAEASIGAIQENILYLSWRRWRLKRVRWNRTESLLKFCPEKEKQSN